MASDMAVKGFWDMDIDFSKGGGVIVLEKNQVKWEGDEQYHFVALLPGGSDNAKYEAIRLKVKQGELIPKQKRNNFGDADQCIENYKILLQHCCYSHYRDIEVSMGTSGYQMQSIGTKDDYRTERYSGGPRFGKYDTYSSLNVENFV